MTRQSTEMGLSIFPFLTKSNSYVFDFGDTSLYRTTFHFVQKSRIFKTMCQDIAGKHDLVA